MALCFNVLRCFVVLSGVKEKGRCRRAKRAKVLQACNGILSVESVDWKVWPCLCLCLLKPAALSGSLEELPGPRQGVGAEPHETWGQDTVTVKIYQAPVAQTAQEFRTQLSMTAEKLEDQRLVKSSHVFQLSFVLLCVHASVFGRNWNGRRNKRNWRSSKRRQLRPRRPRKRKESKRPKRQGFCFQRKGMSFKKIGGGFAHIFP